MLEQAVYTSLRRVDVSARYSSKQLIVILMDASEENGDNVAKRIINCFKRLYTGSNIHMEYGIAKMEGNRKDVD